MEMELGLAAAFMIGLLGSTHCVGMCGGIVGAMTMSLPDQVRLSPARMIPYQLAYNSGRMLSYAAAGLIIGLITSTASSFFQIRFPVGGLVGGLFMLALGIYVAGWYPTLASLERLGGKLWKRIEPLGRKLLPVHSLPQALGLGLLWGWLPCGLVYSTLAWSATAGNALYSAGLMLAFGAGTLPMLLAMGGLAHKLQAFSRNKWVRIIAGLLLIAFGAMMLFKVGMMVFGDGGGMHHHHHHH